MYADLSDLELQTIFKDSYDELHRRGLFVNEANENHYYKSNVLPEEIMLVHFRKDPVPGAWNTQEYFTKWAMHNSYVASVSYIPEG